MNEDERTPIASNAQKKNNDFIKIDKDRDIYKQIFEYSVIPILVHDLEMNIIDANDSAVEIFGFSQQELLNKKVFDLHTENEFENSSKVLERMRKEDKLSVETSFKRKDGSIFMAEATPCKYILEQQPLVHVFIQDITDRKLAEKKLLESSFALKKEMAKVKKYSREIELKNKELEEFSYVAAHDLKAPVTNLAILSDMISAEMVKKQQSSVLFGELKKNVDQLNNTVSALNDVINFKVTLNYENEQLRFEEVFKEIETSISQQLENSKAILDTDFSEYPEIEYPKLHLRSIMQNLITNALKFKDTDKRLKIKIKTTTSNGVACLSVKDNGLGFDASKYREKIFGLFKRLHIHVDGMGVGMYIVKSIVDAHGDKIEVKSKPKEGAEFKIYFKN